MLQMTFLLLLYSTVLINSIPEEVFPEISSFIGIYNLQRPHHRSNSLSQVGRSGVGSRQLGIQNSRRYPVHSDVLSSPHEEYITRHVSGKNKDDYGADMRVSC
jgi:hypothetical protein